LNLSVFKHVKTCKLEVLVHGIFHPVKAEVVLKASGSEIPFFAMSPSVFSLCAGIPLFSFGARNRSVLIAL